MRTFSLLIALFLPVQQASPPAPVGPPAEQHARSPDNPPLPSIATLLSDVEKHEDRDDALLQQYTYHLHEISEDFDGSEQVKKTTVTDSESIPVEGVRVRRIVARNGKPLSSDEAKKEDERFEKDVEKAKKNKARRDEKAAEAKRTGTSNDGFLTASRILHLGTFSNERRITLKGRPTIVLDYAGDRSIKPANSLEKIVEDLVGTVWIDEQDKVLARVEGHFLADFKVGAGLIVDIHKGLSFTMEQEKVNGEVWLPRQVTGAGKASVLVVVARVHGREHVDMSDYRRYRSSATIIGMGETTESANPVPEPPAEPVTAPH